MKKRPVRRRTFLVSLFLTAALFIAGGAVGEASLASLGYGALRWLDRADIVRHDVTARIDPGRLWATFVDDVTLVPEGGRTIYFLLGVDARLDRISWAGEALEFGPFLSLGALPFTLYRVTLPDGVEAPKGQSVQLRFEWTMTPSAVRFINPFIARNFFYVGYASLWYPHMPDEDFFEAEVHVTVPRGYMALAEGRLIEAVSESVGGLSGPPEGGVTYRFQTDRPISGMGIGVGDLRRIEPAVVGDTVVAGFEPAGAVASAKKAARDETVVRAEGGERTEKSARTWNVARVEKVARYSAEAINFFAPRLGALPVSRFQVAELPFAAATSYANLYTLVYGGDLSGIGVRDDAGLALMAAHEAAHKWVGGIAGIRVVGSAWLLEGAAEYLGYLALPHLVAAEDAQSLFERRTYRAFVEAVGSGTPRPLASIEIFESDRELIFHKGAMLFRMLHRRLGDERFYEAVRRFIAEFEGRHASGGDFAAFVKDFVQENKAADAELDRSSSEGGAGVGPGDVAQFFRDWVHGSGALDYALEADVDSRGPTEYSLRLKVTSKGDLVEPGPAPVTVKLADGRSRQIDVEVGETTTVALSAAPVTAVLDPEHWLADADPDDNTWKLK